MKDLFLFVSWWELRLLGLCYIKAVQSCSNSKTYISPAILDGDEQWLLAVLGYLWLFSKMQSPQVQTEVLPQHRTVALHASHLPLGRHEAAGAVCVPKATPGKQELPKSFIVALAWLSCPPAGPAQDGQKRRAAPRGRVHFTRSFTYFQPSAVYSQALLGATDRADITVCTPARKEESYPQNSIPQGQSMATQHRGSLQRRRKMQITVMELEYSLMLSQQHQSSDDHNKLQLGEFNFISGFAADPR